MFDLSSVLSRFRHSEADSPSKIGEGILADFLGSYLRALRIAEDDPECPDTVANQLRDGLDRFRAAAEEVRSSLDVGFPVEDLDLSNTNRIEYEFLFAQRFANEVVALDMGESWGVRLKDEEMLLRPKIRQVDEGFVVEGVESPRTGPFETLNEAVLRLLEGVISTHGACRLDYA